MQYNPDPGSAGGAGTSGRKRLLAGSGRACKDPCLQNSRLFPPLQESHATSTWIGTLGPKVASVSNLQVDCWFHLPFRRDLGSYIRGGLVYAVSGLFGHS